MKSNPTLFKEKYKISMFFHKEIIKHEAKVRVWMCMPVCMCVLISIVGVRRQISTTTSKANKSSWSFQFTNRQFTGISSKF